LGVSSKINFGLLSFSESKIYLGRLVQNKFVYNDERSAWEYFNRGSSFSSRSPPRKTLTTYKMKNIIALLTIVLLTFITAGSADQTVPAKSVFTPAFVDALRFGLGALNKDAYVTGQELGLYLWNKVPEHNDRQTQKK